MKIKLATLAVVALASVAAPADTAAASTSTTAAPTEQWLTCPSVGVPTKIDPILKSGKVTCYYMNANRPSEVLTTRTVSASAPLKSCLRSRANSGRVYCSTAKTQAQLTATAYKWASWTGANQEYTRAKIGWKKKRNGVSGFGPAQNLYPCRFKKDNSYRVGYVDGGKCWAPYKGGQASSSSYENLLLTQEYGEVTSNRRYGAPVLGVPSFQVMVNGSLRTVDRALCLVYIFPDAFDFQGVMGYLPGVRQVVAPSFSQGSCVSSHFGKEMQDSSASNIVLE